MILFGTRGVTSKKGEGAFFCPACDQREHYHHKSVRRFFTLYFIPLIPLNKLGEFVQCQKCENSYESGVLQYDPEAEVEKFKTEWQRAVQAVMIRIMLADGKVDADEVSTIRRIYGELAQRELSEAELLTEIAAIEARGGSVTEDLKEFVPRLNEHGKEMVIRAALAVAAADGEVHEEEKTLISTIASCLNMSQAHFQGIVQSSGENEMEGRG